MSSAWAWMLNRTARSSSAKPHLRLFAVQLVTGSIAAKAEALSVREFPYRSHGAESLKEPGSNCKTLYARAARFLK
jgi:hypothetical protein